MLGAKERGWTAEDGGAQDSSVICSYVSLESLIEFRRKGYPLRAHNVLSARKTGAINEHNISC